MSDKRNANTSQFKIKAVLQNMPTRENALEEVVQWIKFDKVKHIALAIIDTPLPTDTLLNLLSIISKHSLIINNWAPDFLFTFDKLQVSNSYKFLMLRPLVLRILSLTA